MPPYARPALRSLYAIYGAAGTSLAKVQKPILETFVVAPLEAKSELGPTQDVLRTGFRL